MRPRIKVTKKDGATPAKRSVGSSQKRDRFEKSDRFEKKDRFSSRGKSEKPFGRGERTERGERSEKRDRFEQSGINEWNNIRYIYSKDDSLNATEVRHILLDWVVPQL